MTSTNTNLSGPNTIFLNVILAIIAFILIIYLKNIYVTIIAVVIVIGVYFVFDTKLLFATTDTQEGPYIDTQAASIVAPTKEVINTEVHNEETTSDVNAGCSDIDINDENVIRISTLAELESSKAYATDSSKIFVLMNDIDLGDAESPYEIYGSFYETFNASFDGNCYAISNFTISNSDGSNSRIGFFGYVYSETGSNIYIKNVTFTNFSFYIETTNSENKIGIIAQTNSDDSEEKVTLENITVFLQNSSLLTFNRSDTSSKIYYLIGFLVGYAKYTTLLDCNVIISTRYDLLIDNGNAIHLGVMCGWLRDCSVMACSVNLIGSTFLIQLFEEPNFGVLCGRSYTSSDDANDGHYVNLYNNIVIMKDATLKANMSLNTNKYGYLIGSTQNTTINAKNNTIFSMTSQLFDEDKLSGTNLNIDENNTIPTDISVKDMIYGMLLSSGSLETHITKNDPNPDAYWKRTYYVYHEGDTSGMNCRFYNVFNFWLNTDDNLYCDVDDMCNTDDYGTCDDNSNLRGWHQIQDSLTIQCSSDGTRTYTLTTEITDLDDSFESIILNDGDIFDGNNIQISYEGSNGWNGLFKLVETDYKSTIVIKNVNMSVVGNINEGKGGILSNLTSNMKYDIIIENCTCSSSDIDSYAGGIVGEYFCSNTSCECIIRQCSISCEGLDVGAGGICGQYAGSYGKLRIEYCSSDVAYTSDYSGGIVGKMSGSDVDDDYLFIFNSYCNINDTINKNSGGLIAPTNVSGDNTLVLNCYVYITFPTISESETTIIDTSGMWGAIASSTDDGSFKPFIILCDIYYNDSQKDYISLDNSGSPANDQNVIYETYISRGGLNDGQSNYTLTQLFSLVSYSDHNTYLKHLEVFNSESLNEFIINLPYQYISPIWAVGSMSIPENLNYS